MKVTASARPMFWVLGGRVACSCTTDIWTSVGIHGTFGIFLLGGSSKYGEVLNWFYDMNYFDGITNGGVWILEVLNGKLLTEYVSRNILNLKPLLKVLILHHRSWFF